MRDDIPIFLGAEGPKNVALAAEICDGWMALFFSPRNQDFYRDALDEGFAANGGRRSWDDFEVMATVPVIIHDNVEEAADFLRPMYALYFGGMGARGRNFHHDVAVRLGYEAEAKKVQDLYLDGKKDEAAAAIPTKLVEDLALIGPEDKIRDELDAWRESIATTLLIAGDAACCAASPSSSEASPHPSPDGRGAVDQGHVLLAELGFVLVPHLVLDRSQVLLLASGVRAERRELFAL